MSTDLAKLMIVVTTKGAKEAGRDLEGITNKGKDYKKQTEKNTEATKKFTTAQNSFRNTLPTVASGVYLVQQAYTALNMAMQAVEDKYEEQYSAEIQLNAIMKTTSNAVGYTTDQIYAMSDAWSSLTGINDAVIDKAYAIGATFVDISQEAFPGLIEQALNMSTIFRQDLQQSVVQLGVALNNLQVSRLTRIGISFTDAQKEMIASLRNAGKTVEAQQLILAELEREIGGVAEAMGETSLGSIRKYQTAMENMMEELGEKSTNFKAELLDAFNITEAANAVTAALSGINTNNAIEEYADAKTLSDPVVLATLSVEDLEHAYASFNIVIDQAKKRMEGLFTLPSAKKSALAQIADTSLLLAQIEKAIKAKKELNEAEEEAIRLAQEKAKADARNEALKTQQDWLNSLREEYEFRNSLRYMDADEVKFAQEKRKLVEEYNSIMEEGIALGISREQIEQALNGYTSEQIKLLKEQLETNRALAKLKQDQADIEMFGTDDQRKWQDYLNFVKQANEAMARNPELADSARIKIKEYFNELFNPEQEQVLSFLDSFTQGLNGANTAAEILANTGDMLGNTLQNLGTDIATDSFTYMGQALAGLSEGADSFDQVMQQTIASALSSVAPNLIAAGAKLLAINPYDPKGWALVGGGGVAAITGGYLSQSYSNAKEASSNSSNITSSSVISPTTIDASNSTVADTTRGAINFNVINNNNSSISTQETMVNGTRTLQVMIDSAVNNGITNGSYNGAFSSKYGITSTGVNVR